MAMSTNLSLNARSRPGSPPEGLRPASLLSKMSSRGRRPSQLDTSAVSTDEAPPPPTPNMSPGSVVGDIVESGANMSPSATGGKKAPVCVFSFAGPRVGNTRFKKRFEGELGVKTLRIRNVHDMVPKVPGFLFNESILPEVLLRVADMLRVPSVYTHVGVELTLDHIVSPFLRPTGDLASYHNLEAHLHLLDGYRAHGQPFELGGRDPALVNKGTDFLRDEHMVPPGWRQDENKGMVRTEDGRWALLQPPRELGAHPTPDEIDFHLAALGLIVIAKQNGTIEEHDDV